MPVYISNQAVGVYLHVNVSYACFSVDRQYSSSISIAS